jgi:hypothetical protein
MTKAKKNRYSGVGCSVDGTLLSRVQSVSVESDLSTENLNELTNASIVEVSEGLPNISLSIDTNEYGDCQNLYALAGRKVLSKVDATHVVIDENSFDGTSVDVTVQVEEDNVLSRTMYIGDCFVSSLSWSFDVGGVASENYSLEADNKIWYLNTDYAEVYALYAHRSTDHAIICSGVSISTFSSGAASTISVIRATLNNEPVADSGTEVNWTVYDGEGGDSGNLVISGSTATNFAGGTANDRYRVVFSVDSASSQLTNSRIDTNGYGASYPGLSTSSIGGIRKGMVKILLGQNADINTAFSTTDEYLRLQSVGIDVDLTREALEELGQIKAYDRSLTFPIPVSVTFSTIASDLQAWAQFTSDDFSLVTSMDVTDFVRSAGLVVYIYDDDDTNTSRNLLKKIAVEDLRVSNESYSVDTGGNGTQEYTCTSDNFTVSGSIRG